MTQERDQLTIGTFAEAAGVGVETIRFYQKKGLIGEPRRVYGKIRRYGAADVARVRFVRSAQGLGFSLDEIADLLRLEDGTHCDDARALAERKLSAVRTKAADLRRMEIALSKLIRQCRTRPARVTCPLIESLRES